jgi:hypothetical protein
MIDSAYRHPADVIDDFLSKLDEVPGVHIDTGNGVGYAAKRLRSLYDHERDKVPVKVGDRVRVKSGVVYGTSGLEVAGREGKVLAVDWNAAWEYWEVVVEMQASYQSYTGEWKLTGPKHFSFSYLNLEVLESVGEET